MKRIGLVLTLAVALFAMGGCRSSCCPNPCEKKCNPCEKKCNPCQKKCNQCDPCSPCGVPSGGTYTPASGGTYTPAPAGTTPAPSNSCGSGGKNCGGK